MKRPEQRVTERFVSSLCEGDAGAGRRGVQPQRSRLWNEPDRNTTQDCPRTKLVIPARANELLAKSAKLIEQLRADREVPSQAVAETVPMVSAAQCGEDIVPSRTHGHRQIWRRDRRRSRRRSVGTDQDPAGDFGVGGEVRIDQSRARIEVVRQEQEQGTRRLPGSRVSRGGTAGPAGDNFQSKWGRLGSQCRGIVTSPSATTTSNSCGATV